MQGKLFRVNPPKVDSLFRVEGTLAMDCGGGDVVRVKVVADVPAQRSVDAERWLKNTLDYCARPEVDFKVNMVTEVSDVTKI